MHKLTLLLLLAAPLSAHADSANCTPSRLLIVLDKSSSMLDKIGGTSKWSIAKDALQQVAGTYENQIDLGINIFPNPNQCAPGKTLVTPGPGNAGAIETAFGADPPTGGNYTPMSQSIDVAAADPSMADPSRRPSILLVTDGWQWCSPYDAKTRTWPIDSVKAAKAKGISVYVVGFGGAVDVETMNHMAVEAGTAIPGCDPTGTDATSPNKCYYQADSAADLLSALQDITIHVTAEVCDGLDNNCDGQIDEGLVRDCSSSCGAGHETCSLGSWGACDAPATCGECTPGDLQDCSGTGVGACASAPGQQKCQDDHTWGACVNAVLAGSAERCNHIDDDCDGEIDNGTTASLCPEGGVCVDGKCESDPLPQAKVSQPDGCGCQLGGAGQLNLMALFTALGLLLVLARRRAR